MCCCSAAGGYTGLTFFTGFTSRNTVGRGGASGSGGGFGSIFGLGGSGFGSGSRFWILILAAGSLGCGRGCSIAIWFLRFFTCLRGCSCSCGLGLGGGGVD